jgi:hypothetical protein
MESDNTGATVNTLNFGLAEPYKLVRLAERAGETTLALLAIPDVNGNGVRELVRLHTQAVPQPLFAEVCD